VPKEASSTLAASKQASKQAISLAVVILLDLTQHAVVGINYDDLNPHLALASVNGLYLAFW